MATATLPGVPGRADARVRADLARAALRIRVRDAAAGGLGLVALLLTYVAVTVTLDKALELSALARGCGLAAFLLAAGAITYFGVVRPLRRRVNPRYAARQVERAAGGAKNAVINYVDLENEDLAESVRASLAGRAADEAAAADARKVSESRLVTGLLVSCGLLAAVLAGLFLWLKPAPFWSLLTRAFHPNTVATIATRSEITLDAPANGDVTLPAGDSLPVAVTVQGRVPDTRAPDRPRLLVRYVADAEPDEVPLAPAGSAREFGLLLSPGTVQNGFWYSVAAGDARTPEYRVTVRPRPAVLDYDVEYSYPAYTRLKPETARDPKVIALRGTNVSLTVTANRPVKSGSLKLSTQSADVPGETVPEAPEKLRFRFPVTESGQYSVGFTTADGETGDRTPDQRVLCTPDAAPVVTVSAPDADEVALPAAAKLAVDGVAADDFGVTGVVLRMQVAGPVPVPLKPVKYRPETPLKRPADGSFPTTVAVKVSAELAKLTLAKGGAPADLAEGAVVEYWLEATDNCEPTANVGRSKVKRVKIAPPAKTPDEQKQQQQAGEQRAGEEQQHGQKQDQQFRNENRDPQQPRGDQPPPKQGDNPPNQDNQPGNPQPDPNGTKPQNGAATPAGQQRPKEPNGAKPKDPPKTENGADPKPPEGKQDPADGDPTQPQPGGQQPQPPNGGAGQKTPQPGTPGTQGTTTPDQPPAPSPEDQKLQAEKDHVQQELNAARGQKPDAPKPSDPKQGDPPRNGANKPVPKPGDPDRTDPKPGDPQRGDPQQGNPQQGGADPSDPQRGKPNQGQPQQADPKTGDPQRGDPAQGGTQQQPSAADRKAIEDAARDLADPDPAKRRQAEQTLDSKIGRDNRERAQREAEQLKNDLRSEDANVREQARQKLENVAKQAGANAKPQPGTGTEPQPGADPQQKPDPAAAAQAARDLADPAKREQAKDTLDKNVGAANREQLEKQADAAAADRAAGKQADADAKLDAAGKEAARIAEQAGQKPRPGAAGKPPTPDPDAARQAERDLTTGDSKTRQKAEDDLANKISQEKRDAARQKAEQLKNELGSGDPKRVEKAQKEIADAVNKSRDQQPGNGGKPDTNSADKPETRTNPQGGRPGDGTKPDPKAVEQAAKDLASGDAKTRQDAAEKLKGAVGEQQAKDLQQQADAIRKDKEAGGAGTDEKLNDLASKAKTQAAAHAGKQPGQPSEPGANGAKPQGAGTGQQPEPKTGDKPQPGAGGPPDPKAVEKAVNDLKNGTPAEKQAARDTLDRAVGKPNREQTERDAEAARQAEQSGTPAEKAAAPGKMDAAVKRAQDQAKANAGQPRPGQPDPKALADAAGKLNSNKPEEKAAAEKAVDDATRDAARAEAKQLAADLKSQDPATKKAAQQKLKDLQARAGQQGGDPSKADGPQPSPADVEKWKKLADDLAGADKNKRDAAEQAFDKALGNDARKELQKDLNDLKDGTPEQKQAARDRLQQRADQAAKNSSRQRGPGGTGPDRKGDKLVEDARNRLKTTELQLADFEKVKSDPALQRRIGYTPEQYERFLQDVRAEVGRRHDEVTKLEAGPNKPAGPPVLNIGGAQDVKGQGNDGTTGSGPGTAPPGFADAQKKFAEEAAKLKRAGQK